MAIPSIPSIKALMRRVSMADMEAVAREALTCGTAAQVRAAVQRMPVGAEEA